jgi:hypothetical protein
LTFHAPPGVFQPDTFMGFGVLQEDPAPSPVATTEAASSGNPVDASSAPELRTAEAVRRPARPGKPGRNVVYADWALAAGSTL